MNYKIVVTKAFNERMDLHNVLFVTDETRLTNKAAAMNLIEEFKRVFPSPLHEVYLYTVKNEWVELDSNTFKKK